MAEEIMRLLLATLLSTSSLLGVMPAQAQFTNPDPPECDEAGCRTACEDYGAGIKGCIYLNVISRNYPYVTFKTSYEREISEANCPQFKLRTLRVEDGMPNRWEQVMPGSMDYAKLMQACTLKK